MELMRRKSLDMGPLDSPSQIKNGPMRLKQIYTVNISPPTLVVTKQREWEIRKPKNNLIGRK